MEVHQFLGQLPIPNQVKTYQPLKIAPKPKMDSNQNLITTNKVLQCRTTGLQNSITYTSPITIDPMTQTQNGLQTYRIMPHRTIPSPRISQTLPQYFMNRSNLTSSSLGSSSKVFQYPSLKAVEIQRTENALAFNSFLQNQHQIQMMQPQIGNEYHPQMTVNLPFSPFQINHLCTQVPNRGTNSLCVPVSQYPLIVSNLKNSDSHNIENCSASIEMQSLYEESTNATQDTQVVEQLEFSAAAGICTCSQDKQVTSNQTNMLRDNYLNQICDNKSAQIRNVFTNNELYLINGSPSLNAVTTLTQNNDLQSNAKKPSFSRKMITVSTQTDKLNFYEEFFLSTKFETKADVSILSVTNQSNIKDNAQSQKCIKETPVESKSTKNSLISNDQNKIVLLDITSKDNSNRELVDNLVVGNSEKHDSENSILTNPESESNLNNSLIEKQNPGEIKYSKMSLVSIRKTRSTKNYKHKTKKQKKKSKFAISLQSNNKSSVQLKFSKSSNISGLAQNLFSSISDLSDEIKGDSSSKVKSKTDKDMMQLELNDKNIMFNNEVEIFVFDKTDLSNVSNVEILNTDSSMKRKPGRPRKIKNSSIVVSSSIKMDNNHKKRDSSIISSFELPSNNLSSNNSTLHSKQEKESESLLLKNQDTNFIFDYIKQPESFLSKQNSTNKIETLQSSLNNITSMQNMAFQTETNSISNFKQPETFNVLENSQNKELQPKSIFANNIGQVGSPFETLTSVQNDELESNTNLKNNFKQSKTTFDTFQSKHSGEFQCQTNSKNEFEQHEGAIYEALDSVQNNTYRSKSNTTKENFCLSTNVHHEEFQSVSNVLNDKECNISTKNLLSTSSNSETNASRTELNDLDNSLNSKTSILIIGNDIASLCQKNLVSEKQSNILIENVPIVPAGLFESLNSTCCIKKLNQKNFKQSLKNDQLNTDRLSKKLKRTKKIVKCKRGCSKKDMKDASSKRHCNKKREKSEISFVKNDFKDLYKESLGNCNISSSAILNKIHTTTSDNLLNEKSVLHLKKTLLKEKRALFEKKEIVATLNDLLDNVSDLIESEKVQMKINTLSDRSSKSKLKNISSGNFSFSNVKENFSSFSASIMYPTIQSEINANVISEEKSVGKVELDNSEKISDNITKNDICKEDVFLVKSSLQNKQSFLENLDLYNIKSTQCNSSSQYMENIQNTSEHKLANLQQNSVIKNCLEKSGKKILKDISSELLSSEIQSIKIPLTVKVAETSNDKNQKNIKESLKDVFLNDQSIFTNPEKISKRKRGRPKKDKRVDSVKRNANKLKKETETPKDKHQMEDVNRSYFNRLTFLETKKKI